MCVCAHVTHALPGKNKVPELPSTLYPFCRVLHSCKQNNVGCDSAVGPSLRAGLSLSRQAQHWVYISSLAKSVLDEGIFEGLAVRSGRGRT